MVIYEGMSECAYTVNNAGASICVLEPCLAHAWGFSTSLQFGTCPNVFICNQVSIALIIEARHNRSATYVTMSGGHCQQHVIVHF